jgi:membrane-associated phospholipid phosphatase
LDPGRGARPVLSGAPVRHMIESPSANTLRPTALVLLLTLSLAAGDASADAVARAGDVGAVLLPAGAAVGALLGKDKEGLRQEAMAYAVTMAVVFILKPTVDRTRPNGGHYSFPSGHSASAFAGAAFLERRYGWKVGVPALAAAAFVGYSRVESKNHYTSDVVAGAAIAIAANLVFTHPRPKVHVAFDAGRHHVGTLVTIVW